MHITSSPIFAIYDEVQVSRIPKILHSTPLGRLWLWGIREQISSKPVDQVIIGKLDEREVIVSGSCDGVQVWDAITVKLIASIPIPYRGFESSLALYKNFILSVGPDTAIRIWSFLRRQEVAVIEIGESIETMSCEIGDYLAVTTDRGVVTFDLMLDG